MKQSANHYVQAMERTLKFTKLEEVVMVKCMP